MPALRQLPRFEVIRVAKHWCAYDFLTKRGQFATDPKNFLATQGLVEIMAAEARKRGEPLSLERAETPPAKPPRSRHTSTK